MPFFLKKSEEGSCSPGSTSPEQLAEAQRSNDQAGRPPRNQGDGDQSPRGRHCYQNTAGNQLMLPYKVEGKNRLLWEMIKTRLKPF